MARRTSDFDVRAAVLQPGFTPSLHDVDAIAALLTGDDEMAHAAERALAKLGTNALATLLARLRAPRSGDRRDRLVRVVARASRSDRRVSLETFTPLLQDADARVRRAAARALGENDDPASETALLAAWRLERDPSAKRAIAAALGRVGSQQSVTALGIGRTGDAELDRIVGAARLRLRRRDRGRDRAGIDMDRTPRREVTVVLRCRRGLEGIVAGDCPDRWGATVAAPGRVTLLMAAPLRDLFRVRTFVDLAFSIPPIVIGRGEQPGDAVARALLRPESAAAIDALSREGVRYRLAWSRGKHRAETLRCAARLAAERPAWINDPVGRNWEVEVEEEHAAGRGPRLQVALRPRVEDPRFAYRLEDVPAASHPTLAAALVRMAGTLGDDVVWDPFAGSGTELIERALAGPYRRLIGWDRDERAVAAARVNAGRAGVSRLELERRDSLANGAPPRATLILTNPPMGRRVRPEQGLARFVDDFLRISSRSLVAGGRIAWIAPPGTATARDIGRAGLQIVERTPVDMGGFDAELQLLRHRGH